MGAALAITVGIMIVTLLHAATIVKAISLTLYVKQYVAHFVVIVSVAAIGHILVPILPFHCLRNDCCHRHHDGHLSRSCTIVSFN